MRNHIKVFIGCILGIAVVVSLNAWGSQTVLPTSAAATLTAPCSMAGAAAQLVAITSTTAKTSTATGTGVVRVVCSSAVHYVQGVAGVTGVTATTGDTLLPAATVERINASNSTFAFIRDSADGTCFLTECK